MERIDRSDLRPFFFAQVKPIRSIDEVHGRAEVGLGVEVIDKLIRFPTPTDIVAVDRESWRAFIRQIDACDRGLGLSVIPIADELPTGGRTNDRTLRNLADEVACFWQGDNTAEVDPTFGGQR